MAFCRSLIGKFASLYFKSRKCYPFLKYSARKTHMTHVLETRYFRYLHNKSTPYRTEYNSKRPRLIIYSGILTALGIKSEEQEEDKLIHTMKLGILSLQKEEYNKAEKILHVALKLAQEREDPQAVTYIYDILANVAFKKGDLKKAETLFVETMKRSVAAGMSTEDNAVVELSLKLASVFDQQKEFDKAEEGYRFCITTQKQKMDEIDFSKPLTDIEQDTLLLWAMSTDWYGRHLLAKGKLKEAQDNFVKAYEMSERINGPLHHQTLVLLNDIGSVATLREDFSQAIYYLERAIENGKLSGTPDLAAFYCNLGATLMKKGDFSGALKSCQEGLKLAERTNQDEAAVDARECIKELKGLGVK